MTHHDRDSSGNEPHFPHAGGDRRRQEHPEDKLTDKAAGALSESEGSDISLRGPAELADALPYLLGFYPDDSIVAVALHGPRGRFGGRLRIGIPETEEERMALAPQVAECLDASSRARGSSPDGAIIFLCQEPGEGSSGKEIMERLQPLVQRLRIACGELDMPVYEALCLSDGRYFSYCCPDPAAACPKACRWPSQAPRRWPPRRPMPVCRYTVPSATWKGASLRSGRRSRKNRSGCSTR